MHSKFIFRMRKHFSRMHGYICHYAQEWAGRIVDTNEEICHLYNTGAVESSLWLGNKYGKTIFPRNHSFVIVVVGLPSTKLGIKRQHNNKPHSILMKMLFKRFTLFEWHFRQSWDWHECCESKWKKTFVFICHLSAGWLYVRASICFIRQLPLYIMRMTFRTWNWK